MPTEAFITGDLLRWARERADVTPSALARSLKISPAVYAEWEEGTTRPSFRKAQDAARRLHVPFGYLFLSARPEEHLELPDLRTVGDDSPQEPSLDLLDTVEDAMRKQEWFREYHVNQEAAPLPFVARYSVGTPYREVAEDIRAVVGITQQLHRQAKNWEEFLRLLVRQIEAAGILVFRAGIVGSNTRRALDKNEFRGFAISDDIAPAIFVNGADWKSAQIFTLGHELAHIWIGESGVSNPDFSRAAAQQGNAIERLCNRIAAEVLVPENDFRPRWNVGASVESNVSGLGTWYRVSQIVVLRQARDIGLISAGQFSEDYNRQVAEQQARADKDKDNSGGDFYATLLSRSSATLTSAMMSAVSEGLMSPSDAATMLGVKRSTLEGIASRTLGISLDA